MGWLSDFISDPIGTTTDKLGDLGEDIGDALGDVAEWIDEKIIKPIAADPIRFIVIAAAYAYGIPGLELIAGPGTAAATGIASFGVSLAQGKDFDAAAKDGLTTAAFTAAGNYVKGEFFSGAPTVDANGAPIEGGGGNISGGTGDVPADGGGGFDTGGFENLELDAPIPQAAPYVDPTRAPGFPQAPTGSSPLNLEIASLDSGPPPFSNAPATTSSSYTGNAAGQSSAGSVYRSEFANLGAEPTYVPGSGNLPATRTPNTYGPDPDYPNNPNMRVRVADGQPGLPEVVDYSKAASPMEGGTPTAGQVYDYTKVAGNAALDFAIDNPYTVLGGLSLASAYMGKDKPKDGDGGGGDPNKQIGDPRFYMPMQQLQMVQNYDQYKDDIYTYGQAGGEHQFLTSPVYVPVQYADGGQVGMGPVDPMQQQYASPAVGPMMAPQQMPPQQPMGALSQPNVMGYKPSPLTPRTGRPPVPQQMQGHGAPQQIPPQQQNPDYRYFSYGQIPPSVTMPAMQQPQGRATGGLAMARGGNVPDGRTDDIPALLSQGEYVMDAETVALLGNGNNDAGAKRLDHMREAVRKQKGGALAKGKISPDAMSPLAYLSRRMA